MKLFDFQGYVQMDQWLDNKVGLQYEGQPLAQDWARIAKVGEEAGEAIQAFIGVTGQNPRKGAEGTMNDVLNELADTLFTCLLAIQHFTKADWQTKEILERRWSYRLTKMYNTIAEERVDK